MTAKLQQATDFLREQLAGGPVAAKVIRERAERLGIAWRSCERAKAGLGIESRRSGNVWMWSLPGANVPEHLKTLFRVLGLEADDLGPGVERLGRRRIVYAALKARKR